MGHVVVLGVAIRPSRKKLREIDIGLSLLELSMITQVTADHLLLLIVTGPANSTDID